jgi:hypothetical protein
LSGLHGVRVISIRKNGELSSGNSVINTRHFLVHASLHFKRVELSSVKRNLNKNFATKTFHAFIRMSRVGSKVFEVFKLNGWQIETKKFWHCLSQRILINFFAIYRDFQWVHRTNLLICFFHAKCAQHFHLLLIKTTISPCFLLEFIVVI